MKLILASLLLLPWATPTHARTWHIQENGSGDAPTVQAGIDSASVGDTVLVGPGIYLENLSIAKKDLVLMSGMGPESTILSGSNQPGTVIYMEYQTRSTIVEGFTVTGGTSHLGSVRGGGGGIFLWESSPIIRGNWIFANGTIGSTRFGGGIHAFYNASPLIEDNLFESNSADLGGAITAGGANPEIRGNVFRYNFCSLDGGAIYAVFNTGALIIQENQFIANSAGDHGGAIHVRGTSASQVQIARNLFVDNEALGVEPQDSGSGGAMHIASIRGSIIQNTIVDGIGLGESICGGGGLSLENTLSDMEISRNIFAFNRSCGISCRSGTQNSLGPNLFWMNQDGDLGSANAQCPPEWWDNQIFADPYFCAPQSDDYRLAANSPAVGMGAFPDPGCPPVSVRPTTWGRLKALYR